jgi:hypothetical protein
VRRARSAVLRSIAGSAPTPGRASRTALFALLAAGIGGGLFENPSDPLLTIIPFVLVVLATSCLTAELTAQAQRGRFQTADRWTWNRHCQRRRLGPVRCPSGCDCRAGARACARANCRDLLCRFVPSAGRLLLASAPQEPGQSLVSPSHGQPAPRRHAYAGALAGRRSSNACCCLRLTHPDGGIRAQHVLESTRTYSRCHGNVRLGSRLA